MNDFQRDTNSALPISRTLKISISKNVDRYVDRSINTSCKNQPWLKRPSRTIQRNSVASPSFTYALWKLPHFYARHLRAARREDPDCFSESFTTSNRREQKPKSSQRAVRSIQANSYVARGQSLSGWFKARSPLMTLQRLRGRLP